MTLVRVSPDVADMLLQPIFEAMGEAILDDFAKFPEADRPKWRAEAARLYGFATFDELRREVLDF